MKERKTVLDAEIGFEVKLKEYYNSNPSTMKLKEGFDLKCKKCGSKYVVIGFAHYGHTEENSKKYPVMAPIIVCLKCHSNVILLPYRCDGQQIYMVDREKIKKGGI